MNTMTDSITIVFYVSPDGQYKHKVEAIIDGDENNPLFITEVYTVTSHESGKLLAYRIGDKSFEDESELQKYISRTIVGWIWDVLSNKEGDIT